METLTRQEEDLLQIIYRHGKGFIRDFIQYMDEPRPPYTTVASVIKNLERKGFVKGKHFTNTYEYSPTMDESEFKAKYLSKVVDSYFGNSYKELVNFFVDKQKISPEELKEIIDLIEKKK